MTKANGKPLWRTVALPAEHGGWGFLLQPILLGLFVVPSAAGGLLALAVFASFLARTPLKIVWKDRQRGRRYARTEKAAQFLTLYGLFVFIGLGGAAALEGWRPLTPLLLAGPLIVAQLYYDLFSSSRKLLPELMGPVALAAVTAGMALAAGWPWPLAAALWAIPVLHALPAILYVRARLRLDKGQPAASSPVILAHIAALVGAIALAQMGWIPLLPGLAFILLLLRAALGLSPYRRPIATKTIGWLEMLFSLLTVLLTAIGYWF